MARTAACSAVLLAAALAGAGCLTVGEVGGPVGDDEPDAGLPPPPAKGGAIVAPRLGDVLDVDPATATLTVSGVHARDGARVDVQLLANPDDLASWVTVAQATVAAGAWQATVRPVTDGSQVLRWPDGGVLRLRAVDDTGQTLRVLDHDAEACLKAATDKATCYSPFDMVVLVDASPVPSSPMLVDKPQGSVAETELYYQTIDAPATLDAFRERFGFGPPGAPLPDELGAVYYNVGDLGIGRDMHCRALAGGGTACYVRNFGEFGGDPTAALIATEQGTSPFATVAMVYVPPIDAPNAVRFMVYDAAGDLLPEAKLDTRGDNVSVPQNCIECHGARATYDAATHAVKGARFLPFDPDAFQFSSSGLAAQAAQQEQLRALNALVLAGAPAPGVAAIVEGWYKASGGVAVKGSTVEDGWVPLSWKGSDRDARAYREVLAPTCRGCHAGMVEASGAASPLTFAEPASVTSFGAAIMAKTCGDPDKRMPSAEASLQRFWRSPARAYLVAWLGAPGACGPGTPVPPPAP